MDISNQALLVIIATFAMTMIALAVSHFIVPRYLLGFLRWMDDIIPADQSSLVKPIARFVELVLGLIIVTAAAFTIASQLGTDMSGVLDNAESGGAAVGRWFLGKILIVSIIVIVAFLAIRFVSRLTSPIVEQYLAHRVHEEKDSPEVQRRTDTLQRVISNTLSTIIAGMAFFMILSELGVNIAPILAGAGVAGIAIGFGAQSLIKDILSGVFIMLEDQFRVGDVAQLGGVTGVIEDINLRRTTLRDLNLNQHIIPNGEIGIASNYTKERSRVNMDLEVAYKEDLDRVMEIITRVGAEIADDPEWGPRITDPLKAMRVQNFGSSGIAIKVMGETVPMQQWAVAGEFRRRIKRVFDNEGIEIPFPHVTFYWGEGMNPLSGVTKLLDHEQETRFAPDGVSGEGNAAKSLAVQEMQDKEASQLADTPKDGQNLGG